MPKWKLLDLLSLLKVCSLGREVKALYEYPSKLMCKPILAAFLSKRAILLTLDTHDYLEHALSSLAENAPGDKK